MITIMSPLSTSEEQAPSSPLSTPEEPALCSPEFLVQRSTVSPTVATTEVPKTSDRTQVEAKEIRLSDMPPVTLDDSNMHTKTDDTSEMNIPEDFDNRPSKKAKNSESGVLEPSPMSFMAYKDDLEWSLRVPATGLWSSRRAVTRELIPGSPACTRGKESGQQWSQLWQSGFRRSAW